MDLHRLFYAIIQKIPRGRVATYGQIARLAGLPRHSRQVGYALAACSGNEIPWHRVINAQGEISLRALPHYADRQYLRLRKEGVKFNKEGHISLSKFQWHPQNDILGKRGMKLF